MNDKNDDLIDTVNDNVDNLEDHVNDLDDKLNKLLDKSDQDSSSKSSSKSSAPIVVNVPRNNDGKSFIDDNYDEDNSENGDGSGPEEGSSEDKDEADENGDCEDSENTDSDDNDNGSKAATKADMQKLADYIKDETEKSRPTIPKELAGALGAIGIGIVLKKYAMLIGGRRDVFR